MVDVTATPATAPSHASAPAQRRGTPLDWLLALLGHFLVGASWVLLTLSLMGSLDVARRMVMNSEFAWDTGRLPQPWVIPLALVAVWFSHRFFLWAMGRAGSGRPAWNASVVAFAGIFLGVLVGTYLWTPPLQVGARVGPMAGVSEPWGPLAWIAYHAHKVLPIFFGLLTAFLLLFSRQSPLVVIVKALARWGRGRRARRADRADS